MEQRKVRWEHTFQDLGIVGQIPDSHEQIVQGLIPKDLTGKTVLDLACWDGYYSRVAAQHGAKLVVGVDNCSAEMRMSNLSQEEAIHLVMSKQRQVMADLPFHFIPLNVLDIDRLPMQFDLVMCFGIYYHLPDPYTLFEKIRGVCREQLVIEGMVNPGESQPVMYYIKPGQIGGDPTNYWAPTSNCMKLMLERVGFHDVEHVATSGDRGLFRCLK